MNLPVYYLRMRKSMNSKIIFWFFKKNSWAQQTTGWDKNQKVRAVMQALTRDMCINVSW